MNINAILDLVESTYAHYLILSPDAYTKCKEAVDEVCDKFPVKLCILPYIEADKIYLVPKSELDYDPKIDFAVHMEKE